MNLVWPPLFHQKRDDIMDHIDAALAFIYEIEVKAMNLKDHPLKRETIPALFIEMKWELIIKSNHLIKKAKASSTEIGTLLPCLLLLKQRVYHPVF